MFQACDVLMSVRYRVQHKALQAGSVAAVHGGDVGLIKVEES
jgi:hypothetical protein